MRVPDLPLLWPARIPPIGLLGAECGHEIHTHRVTALARCGHDVGVPPIGFKRQSPVEAAPGNEGPVTTDPLCGRPEHLGRDAEFPALRGPRTAEPASLTLPFEVQDGPAGFCLANVTMRPVETAAGLTPVAIDRLIEG